MIPTNHPHSLFSYCPACGSKSFVGKHYNSMVCTTCNLTLYHNTAAAVVALIRNEQGQILLTTRKYNPHKNTLDLPGGFVDPKERVEDALARELHEELQISLASYTFKGSYPNDYEYGGVLYHTADIVFECVPKSLLGMQPSDDVADAQFYDITPTLIAQVGLPSIKKVLTDYMNGLL